MKTIVLIITLALVASAFSEEKSGVLNKIHTYSRTDLEKLALAAEKLSDEKAGVGIKFGGVHDYIFKCSTDRVKQVIRDYILANPELNKPELLEKLADLKPQPEGLSFVESLAYKSRIEISSIALSCEKFVREKNNQILFGGLHDYIDSLDDAALIKYIKKVIKKNPELADGKQLIELSGPKIVSLDEIKDFLSGLDRDILIKMTIIADEYDREQFMRFGGATEYAFRLGAPQLIEVLLQFFEKYPELRNEGYFRSLGEKYEDQISGALFSQVSLLLDTLDKDTLIEVALECERYYKTKFGQRSLGGLHDYIFRLSETEIQTVIRDYIANHKELQSAEFIDTLLKNPKFTVRSTLSKLPVQDLRYVAIALEAYERDLKGLEHMMGGLEDYIRDLGKEDCMKYIVDKLNMYPQLNTPGELFIQLKKFGYELKQKKN